MFFVLGAALSSMGPGNIATAALLAPLAMATASRAGIPLFLMAIMVGNGANAGALSPFAPTGIIVNGLMARIGLPGLEMADLLYNLAAHALVAFSGYALFGGLKLFGRRADVERGRRRGPAPTAVRAPPLDHDGGHRDADCQRHLRQVNVGMGAFLGAVILVLSRSADDGEAFKRMPVARHRDGVRRDRAHRARRAGTGHRPARVAGREGRVREHGDRRRRVSDRPRLGLQQHLGRGPAGVPADGPGPCGRASGRERDRPSPSSMNIGGHLVDVSPLSTIGALCIAGARCDGQPHPLQQASRLGSVDGVVGALLCYLVF